ncbi:MAG: peptidase M15A [candidate division Zixibacteria bacterium HGW-Zixibacteria-1]|nr:MAG: peptidase M15A [candidate division Zixibacteria bacterium HGW-Zixibacteria-1]
MHFFTKISFSVIALVCITVMSVAAMPAPDSAYVTDKASFTVKVNDLTFDYSIMSLFLMPSEEITIEIPVTDKPCSFDITALADTIAMSGDMHWQWTAPEQSGLYQLNIVCREHSDTTTVNIFVLIPYGQMNGEYLNGYHIGRYPKALYKGLPTYKPPPGFVEITEENAETRLTPHFRLKQFACKQNNGYPKYVVLRELLLIKLEVILQALNEKGYRCGTFNILSGYRTPQYNKTIGNVKYSRHQWGDAADIFIDENPKDDMMDDLNKDGKINWKDAAVMYDIIDDMSGKKIFERLIGGLARYKRTGDHGPFVHVDVRGYRARWGY